MTLVYWRARWNKTAVARVIGFESLISSRRYTGSRNGRHEEIERGSFGSLDFVYLFINMEQTG
jgi:hypothetical protein